MKSGTSIEHTLKFIFQWTGKYDRIDEFLEAYDWSNLTQKEINNLNRCVTSNESGAVIKNLWTGTSPGADVFGAEF